MISQILNRLYKKDRNMKRGFTLVELMIVVAIIAIIVAISIPTYRTARDHGLMAQDILQLESIGHAIDMYYAQDGVFPAAPSNGSGLLTSPSAFFGPNYTNWYPNNTFPYSPDYQSSDQGEGNPTTRPYSYATYGKVYVVTSEDSIPTKFVENMRAIYINWNAQESAYVVMSIGTCKSTGYQNTELVYASGIGIGCLG